MTTKEKYLKICLNLLVAAVVLFFILFAVPKLLVFFMPFVVGWIIATIANPLVRFFEMRLKIVRKHGTAIVIVLVLAVIVLISYGIIGKIVTEAMEFAKDFPTYVESIKADYTEISENMNDLINKLPKGISKQVDSFTDGLGDIGAKLVKGISAPTFGALGQAASHVPSILIGIIFGFLASYFFIADREIIYGWIGKHIPESTKEKGIRAFGEVKNVVGGYFKAQFKIMFVVYVIVTIGLFILHVPFALLAGLGIAFLDMLPFFGTGTVLCPWALLKFMAGDHKMAIGLLIIYAVSQLVRQLIQPKLLGDSIGLNPFATLFFMYLGYQWGSVLGMIIAVPIAMIIINLSKAGVFDNFIYTIRLLVDDINTRRKYDK